MVAQRRRGIRHKTISIKFEWCVVSPRSRVPHVGASCVMAVMDLTALTALTAWGMVIFGDRPWGTLAAVRVAEPRHHDPSLSEKRLRMKKNKQHKHYDS